ncbi:phosphoribosyltransferase family protein [Helicobacter mesocricetorum]|uniref:phosphoribosyltransferase family protein n=1 Tax=Helicobacter mesocricetorum TaxID=87012 RepID=UPI000CF0D576|nr:phosphoribosyltransferase family protein [Helicobacter mesocricetorum]
MRCLLCGKWCFGVFCSLCCDGINISPKLRQLPSDFRVYSFYEYSHIQYLLQAKYHLIGHRIYEILCYKAIVYLQDSLKIPLNAYGIGIDDKVGFRGYAHNAIFLKHLKKLGIKPLFHTLLARNNVSYAGKDLKFRQNNPRNFILQRNVEGKEIILIDDIITTGLTLQEAKRSIEYAGGKVLMALVLSDADT